MCGRKLQCVERCLLVAACVAAFTALCPAQNNPWLKATPPAGLENAAPFDVDMSSATDGWLVGVEIGEQATAPPVAGLTLQLSGAVWSKVTPPTVTENWALYGVSCTPDGTWFAGSNAAVDLEIEDPFAKDSPSGPEKQEVTTSAVTLFQPNEGNIAIVANELALWMMAVCGFGADDAWFASGGTMAGLSGSGWSSTFVSGMASIYDIAFSADDDGWAVGANGLAGAAAHFDGAAWTAVTLPTITSPWELQGVSFPSATQGWAVGQVLITTPKQTSHYEGVILRYASGVWSIVTPPAVSDDWYLEDVCFPTASEGWAVGKNLVNDTGVILHYAGGAWQVEESPITDSADWSLACVSFSDTAHGWAAGYDNANEAFLLLKYRPQPVDVNADSEINAVDVQLVINAALGLTLESGADPDVDANGLSNAIDVQKVINGALGIFS